MVYKSNPSQCLELRNSLRKEQLLDHFKMYVTNASTI